MKDDLGIKIAENKEIAAWTRIKEKAEEDNEINKRAIIINKKIVKVAEGRIKAEKAKIRKS